MSKSFFEISRLEHVYRPVGERVQDFDEVEAPLPQGEIAELSRRCQNCGYRSAMRWAARCTTTSRT